MVLTAAANPAYLDLRETEAIEVYDTADTFYSGALVEEDITTGKASPLGTGTGPAYFYGVCSKSKTFGATSGSSVALDTREKCWKSVTVTGASAATDRGKPVYCSTDDIDDATLTYATGAICIGTIYRWISGTTCHIKLFTPTESYAHAHGGYRYDILASTTSLALDQNDLNMLHTTRGGSGSITFTLPAVASKYTGMWVEFMSIGSGAFTVAGTANELVTFNDATATSVAFSTGTEIIGAAVKAVCDGTSWLIFVMSEETQTMTVA